TSPRYPRLFRAWSRPLEAVLAEQTRRAAAARKSQTNPTALVSIAADANADDNCGQARNDITKRTQAVRPSPAPRCDRIPSLRTKQSRSRRLGRALCETQRLHALQTTQLQTTQIKPITSGLGQSMMNGFDVIAIEMPLEITLI